MYPSVAPSPELIDLHFSPRVTLPSGTGSSGVMCCAEAPGRHEDQEGIVLHPKADAGSVFDRALRRAGIIRDTLTLTNACWQRPPSNELADTPYLVEALRYWKPFNNELIRERAPKVVMLLGNVALKAFTQYGYTDKTTILHMQGYPLEMPEYPGLIFLPSLHPSFILHGQQAHNQTLIWALQRAFQLAREGIKPLPTQYVTHPSEWDMLQFERGYNPERHFLSFDIETPESTRLDEAELEDTDEDISYDIKRASLCYNGEDGYAISFPWQEPFIAIAKRMLASYSRKEVWNNYFDLPRLRAAGCVINGRIYDRMQSWRFLQPTLPASLEYASPLLGWSNPPWKSLSEQEPEFYSAVDAHALRRNGMAIEAALRARNLYERHERHVTEIYEILTLMSRNGLPYDKEEAARFKIKLEALKLERETELQRRVPEELKPVKQAHGYKKTPKSLVGCVQRTFELKWEDLTELERASVVTDAGPAFSAPALSSALATPPMEKVKWPVTRWALLKPFLPTSHSQMKKLIKWAGFKVGTNRKTKKETSDDETKRKIIARCINSKRGKDQEFGKTLKMCREVSQLSKVLGTYVKGWRPGADGRIHATPGFWGKMFRISWRNPNTSATIQDKQEEFIAAGFRKCVATSSDRILVEADWKGIEGVIVGWLAKDTDYVRLAKIGVHDYFCAHILAHKGKIPYNDIPSLSLTDDELKVVFKGIKKRFPKDRDDAKHCIAEGQLVLTQDGLVPIQNITLAHQLWDGIEWVTHDGVIDQGIREVITHDGLTATADHQVVTTKGRIVSFGEAASALARLETTGIKRKAIRSRHHYLLERSARERIYEAACRMHTLPSKALVTQGQSSTGEDQWVPYLRSSSNGRGSAQTRVEVGGDDWEMPTPSKSGIQALRWARDQSSFQISSAFHQMDVEESPTSHLLWDRDRSDRQRRELRTGEFEIVNSEATEPEQEKQSLAYLQREDCFDLGFRQPLREIMDTTSDPSRDDRRANHRERSPTDSTRKSLQGLEKTSKMAQTARVYDILNAGPRRCFTVSSKLVLNCVHGQNYGMTPPLMSSMYEMPISDAEQLVKMYFDLFPKIKAWQESVKIFATEKVYLTNPFGYRMPFWEIYRWNATRYDILAKTYDRVGKMGADGMPFRPNMRQRQWIDAIDQYRRANIPTEAAISKLCWDLGDDAKSAISFLPRDTAAGMLREALLRLRPLAEKGWMCSTAHDAILVDCPRPSQSEVEELLYTEMTRPVPELGGLVVDVEVKAGPAWDSEGMEVIDVAARLSQKVLVTGALS